MPLWICRPGRAPCPAGDTTSDTSVVIFGDSHAAQWLAALETAGQRAGWRVYGAAMGNCPSVFVTTKPEYLEDQGRSCQRWRTDVLAWLASDPPDAVILSNLGGYTFVDPAGREISDGDRDRVWSRGLREMLESLPASSRVAVLAETPNPRLDPVACLRNHRLDMSACVARRSDALHQDREALDRSVATAAGAMFGSLNPKICSYDPCPVVQGRILIWRDQGHLTATFSRQLAPAMQAFVAKVLALW
jgi:hypothetical protein